MTEAQKSALRFLATVEFAAPSEIGQAMLPNDHNPHRSSQGYGRIGGAMAHRLIKAGFACNASHQRHGFPAYSITAAGRKAIGA